MTTFSGRFLQQVHLAIEIYAEQHPADSGPQPFFSPQHSALLPALRMPASPKNLYGVDVCQVEYETFKTQETSLKHPPTNPLVAHIFIFHQHYKAISVEHEKIMESSLWFLVVPGPTTMMQSCKVKTHLFNLSNALLTSFSNSWPKHGQRMESSGSTYHGP